MCSSCRCSILSSLLVLASAGCDLLSPSSPDATTQSDAGGLDAADAATAPDAAAGIDRAAPPGCFEFSLEADFPLAIDGTFTASSPTWRRPHDDPPICPATALLPTSAAEVPLVAYSFCNTDTQAHRFDFEMLAQDGSAGEQPLDDPYLILYSGIGIPDDPLQCLAANDDIPDALEVTDSEILGLEVAPGGAVTMVGTTFTFDPGDGTGTGYYILVVSVAD